MQMPGRKHAGEVIDKVTEAARSIGTLTVFTLAIAVSALIISVVALVMAHSARRAATA